MICTSTDLNAGRVEKEVNSWVIKPYILCFALKMHSPGQSKGKKVAFSHFYVSSSSDSGSSICKVRTIQNGITAISL